MKFLALAPLLAAASIAGAADLAPSAGPAAVSVAPPSPPLRHATSSATAAKVSAGLPKFSPPKPAAAESPDQRDADQPRNGIIRLPKYIVRERKLPELSNREMLTPDGRLDLAFKRHPGLLFGNFFNLNAGIGLAMLAEEQQIERNSEMADLAELARLADTAREPPPKNAAPPPAPVEKK